MTPLELARKYMEAVFTTGDFDQLRQILSDDLNFQGPMFSFDSADKYINAMKADPPVNFQYELLNSYEDSFSACLVYRFSKQGVSTTMIQTFKINSSKITEILLVFDTGAFKNQET